MATAYLDEGLARFRQEWLAAHPGATVYWIADDNHSQNPRVSQHAKDDGKSGGPGDDPGEVDAVDVMPGKGVTDDDLEALFEGLIESRDERILYVIYKNTIVSSRPVGGHPAWARRPYGGNTHRHVHLSVNDNYDKNTSDWKWEDEPVREVTWIDLEDAKIPLLILGDEDADFTGYKRIARAQHMLNWLDNSLVDLETDGVYGAKTAQKLAKVMASDPNKTTSNGSKLGEAEFRRLYALAK